MKVLTRLVLSVAAVALLDGALLFAQTKATAENVPTIPHSSVPNFFKLPADLYFGEGIGIATNSKGHVFVYHRSGDTRLFEFDPTAPSSRNGASASTASSSRTRCASIRRTTSGSSTRGRTWSSSSTPQGRVVMVLGRRPEAVAGATQTQNAQNPPVLDKKYGSDGRPTLLGSAGQHFRLRRLREFARR